MNHHNVSSALAALALFSVIPPKHHRYGIRSYRPSAFCYDFIPHALQILGRFVIQRTEVMYLQKYANKITKRSNTS